MSFVHRDSPYQDKRRARTSASAFRGTAPLKRAAQASDKAAVAEASVAEAAVWRIAPMSGAHRALEGAAHAPASKHAPAPLPLRAVLLPLRPAHAALQQLASPHAAHIEGLHVLRVEFTQAAPVAPAAARPVGEVKARTTRRSRHVASPSRSVRAGRARHMKSTSMASPWAIAQVLVLSTRPVTPIPEA
eukprot:CAMPEP_0180019146 /NCGR_PEP_ID=MMETSP0984-20121128/20920_1 /TAXON_ID=483367 /ORGANISM="non described non described, Strain CCMP 2436" /LENGTH=188 /DNA_ID=CAMNT_0021942599 /DNA_START=291 /DNA_END=857 /DNA_ORIENTATION=-